MLKSFRRPTPTANSVTQGTKYSPQPAQPAARATDERGAALAMVLLTVVLLFAISIAMSEFVVVGLRRTDSAREQLAARSAAETLQNWYLEELTFQRDPTCTETLSNAVVDLVFPSQLLPSGTPGTISCQYTGTLGGYPVVEVVTNSGRVTITSRIQVSTFERRIAVLSWQSGNP